jgi:hypothetical protein
LNENEEDLVERVALVPDKDWVISFLQLAKVALSTVETIGLPESDPRLVTSMAQSDRFGIAVNNRYVLGAFFNDPVSIGFIHPDGVEILTGWLTSPVVTIDSNHSLGKMTMSILHTGSSLQTDHGTY